MEKTLPLEKATIAATFDQIAPKYDLVNRVLSLGLDILWRKALRKYLPIHHSIRLLDLASGTGDQIFTLMDHVRNIKSAIGIDLAKEMLERAKKKSLGKPYSSNVSFLEADACIVPLNDETIDCVTMSYGIRNVPDPRKCLQEMYRVLAPRGRALILEFSLPDNPLLRALHLFYLRRVVPLVGGLFTRNTDAYTYLNKTIETFPYGSVMGDLIEDVGFSNVQVIPFTFGITTLYVAEKE